MKNILTIIKKEFARFFKDRRMVLSVFLPGIMIFLLYTLMGTVMSDVNKVDEDYKYTAYVINIPEDDEISPLLLSVLDLKQYESEEAAKTAVTDGNLDLVISFPKDFIEGIGGDVPPDVKIYFNASVDNSLKST